MEGGIIVTKDKEIYHLAKSLRAHGWTRDIPSGTSIYEEGNDDLYEAYRFILPGYNARPLELKFHLLHDAHLIGIDAHFGPHYPSIMGY